MTYKDYERLKTGQYQSVGKFGDNIYAYEVLTGFASIPEYKQITKREFNSFEIWKQETPTDLGIMYEIHNRPTICSGYRDKTELKNIYAEVICHVCGENYLVDGSLCCPNCHKILEKELITELKEQLRKAEIKIENLGQVLGSYYLNPYSHYDMVGYIEIGEHTYNLRVDERGKNILEYMVTEVKEAAYWILSQLVYRVELEKMGDNLEWNIREIQILENVKADFKKMEACYDKWLTEGRNILNFKED